MSVDQVRIVSGSDLSLEEELSSITRRHAVSEPELWAGISSITSGVETGWHHHGTNTTVFYMISGSLRVEYGSDPVESGTASQGDFAVVPAGVVHREIVEGSESVAAVVVRFGDGVGPLVIEVDGPDAG
jgi:uncharacterized RmlC-like cupin family protein